MTVTAMHRDLFSQLIPTIRAFGSNQKLEHLIIDKLTIAADGSVRSVYAPFDHVPITARLAIVGITPGRTQAENALRAAGAALRVGKSSPEAARLAKLTASFSGAQTRNNLVSMLDAVGIAPALGVRTCAEVFDPARELVHFTSALRYPVFVNGKNYNGSPHMIRTHLLRRMVETYLADEVAALPNALWLPLGPKPAIALRHLVQLGVLPAARVLDGMPHPSGLNGERVAAFLGRVDSKSASIKTNVAKLTSARELLRRHVADLLA